MIPTGQAILSAPEGIEKNSIPYDKLDCTVLQMSFHARSLRKKKKKKQKNKRA